MFFNVCSPILFHFTYGIKVSLIFLVIIVMSTTFYCTRYHNEDPGYQWLLHLFVKTTFFSCNEWL